MEKIETDVQNLKANSQQHDSKNAELRCSADEKQPELKGDVGNSLKPMTLLMLQVQAKELWRNLHQKT